MKTTGIIFSAFWILWAGVALSGELQPFELPSHKGNASQQAPPPPKPQEPNVNEGVYETFKEKAKNLDAKIKKELSQSLEKKQNDAMKEKNWDKAKHYTKLLKILEGQ